MPVSLFAVVASGFAAFGIILVIAGLGALFRWRPMRFLLRTLIGLLLLSLGRITACSAAMRSGGELDCASAPSENEIAHKRNVTMDQRMMHPFCQRHSLCEALLDNESWFCRLKAKSGGRLLIVPALRHHSRSSPRELGLAAIRRQTCTSCTPVEHFAPMR